MDRVEDYGRIAGTLVRYVEEGKTDQAQGVLTVPTAAYTDPARWQREMDLIFKRLPLLLALSIELPRPGDFKTMDVLGVPVLLTRGRDGRARAMMNVCAHRAATVAQEPRGNCSRFSCIYHGWTYGPDGTLIGVADPQKFGEIDKTKRGLTQLPCEERAGMIFVILTPGLPIDLEGFLGGMLEELAQFRFETWHYCGSREVLGANWKVAYDGYLEGYHFASAHPKTIHPRTYSNVMAYDAFGPHMRIGFPQTGIAEKLKAVPEADWGRCENKAYDFVRTLFPNVSIFVAPEITQIAQLIPGPQPNQNRTVLNFVVPKAPATEAEETALGGMMDFLRDVVNDEDYGLGLKVQKGLEAGAFDSVVFGRNERGNQLFHRYVDYYLKDDPSARPPGL